MVGGGVGVLDIQPLADQEGGQHTRHQPEGEPRHTPQGGGQAETSWEHYPDLLEAGGYLTMDRAAYSSGEEAGDEPDTQTKALLAHLGGRDRPNKP